MADTPTFFGVPHLEIGQVTTANTNRDGTTGSYITAFTADASGSKVNEVRVVAAGTTTAGVVRLFLNDGSAVRLLAEILVTAITPGASTEVFTARRVFENLVLPSGWTIKASTHNSENINVIVMGADAA